MAFEGQLTWSEVVYDGMLVYSTLVIFDFSGVSGESVWVAYSTRSVHEGVLFELDQESMNKLIRRREANTYTGQLHPVCTYNCT